jgi:DNA-binding MarR family transcriptional regulator
MRTVIDNAYIAYRSMRRRLQGTLWPPELDPLCAILVDNIWRNGSSIGIASLRIRLALPASTLSTALRRLEDDGLIRRYQNRTDGRYIEVVLTRAGEAIAPGLADLITEVEVDVHESAGGPARGGFARVAWMLAAMDEDVGYPFSD